MDHTPDDDDLTDDDFEALADTPEPVTAVSGARSIQSKERQKKALALRRAGASFQVIAEEVGYGSANSAARAVRTALNADLREASDEYVALQMMRSEQLLMVQWQAAMTGDERAWDRAMLAVKHIDGYVKGSVGGNGELTVNVSSDGGTATNVLVIQGDTDSYKAGLREMAKDHGFSFDSDEVEDDAPDDDLLILDAVTIEDD
jgi:hypothetical protein